MLRRNFDRPQVIEISRMLERHPQQTAPFGTNRQTPLQDRALAHPAAFQPVGSERNALWQVFTRFLLTGHL